MKPCGIHRVQPLLGVFLRAHLQLLIERQTFCTQMRHGETGPWTLTHLHVHESFHRLHLAE